MRFIVTCALLLLSVQLVCAQEDYTDFVKVGDELTLGEPAGSSYMHINIPRKNFIIKRGGIPNMSVLENSKVTVTKIVFGKSPEVVFKNTSGKKFFRVYKTLTADLNEAIASGELKIPQEGGKGAVVR